MEPVVVKADIADMLPVNERTEQIARGYALLRQVAPIGLLDMGQCSDAGYFGNLAFLDGQPPKTTPLEVMYEHERRKTRELNARMDPDDVRLLTR